MARVPDDPVAHYVHGELAGAGRRQGGRARERAARAGAQSEIRPGAPLPRHTAGRKRRRRRRGRGVRETVRLDPAHARGWNNLGNTLRTQRSARRGGSRVCARRRAQARLLAGRCQSGRRAARSGRDGPRRSDAARGARVAPGRIPTGRCVVLLAGVLRLRSMLDESAQLYVQAINAAPSESAGEWFNLGLVLAERNDPAGARKRLRPRSRARPDRPARAVRRAA